MISRDFELVTTLWQSGGCDDSSTALLLLYFFFLFYTEVICTGLNGQLQLAEVPLVHVVVPHQLVTAGKLLQAVGPAAVKGLLTWWR